MAHIFITGASSGLGKATANQLAKQHNCILHGRDLERLKVVGDACSQHGKDILLFPYDLLQVETLSQALSSFLKEKNVTVKAFVHFAGITEVLPMSKTKYSVGLDVMKVNYFSACEIISTLLKRRVNENSLKDILLISSIAASCGTPHQPHYCASKGVINSLGITLARDLSPKIRVNVISPGSFNTPMWQIPIQDDKTKNNWCPKTLLPCGNPQDLANVADFLLSPQAGYITGVNIAVDGGELYKSLGNKP